MNAPGHPTRYKPEYRELAHNHCLLGASNLELAELFAVAPRTIDNSIATVPGFAAGIREGRAVADGRAAAMTARSATTTRSGAPRPATLRVAFSSSRGPLYRCERIILPNVPALGAWQSSATLCREDADTHPRGSAHAHTRTTHQLQARILRACP
jgi:hypothetical protein